MMMNKRLAAAAPGAAAAARRRNNNHNGGMIFSSSRTSSSFVSLVGFAALLLLSCCCQPVGCFAVVGVAGLASPSTSMTASAASSSISDGSRKQQQQQRGSSSTTIMSSSTSCLFSSSTSDDDDQSLRGGAGETAVILDPVHPRSWPAWDKLDKRLISLALPIMANFAIAPLIGAVDLFWVNRMGTALAVAGQSAANQVFNSLFFLTSFLPAITATLVSKENAANNPDGVRNAVGEALFVGIAMALITSCFILSSPDRMLSSVLQPGAPAMAYAKPYLLIRAFAFLPSLISLVGFSAFRGILDTLTPVKVSLFANVFNAVLDPILIFTFAMGVPGAALATLAAEIISAVTYLVLLKRKKMLEFRTLFHAPAWSRLKPLIQGGAALQLRNVALNLTFLAVARVVQGIDPNGVAAAAHALSIQTFQVGGIVLLGLSTVAQTVIPNDLIERVETIDETGQVVVAATASSDKVVVAAKHQQRKVGGLRAAKISSNRLMCWGLLLGALLGSAQIALIPAMSASTPLQEVRDAARIPSIMGSIFQVMNGLVFIGEGIMVGTGSFMQLSISTVIATAGCLVSLNTFPAKYGLTGVWMSFGVWNLLRLGGVTIHQLFYGPLSSRRLKKDKML